MEQVSPRVAPATLFLILPGERVPPSSSRCCRASAVLECIVNKAFAKYWKTIVVTVSSSAFPLSFAFPRGEVYRKTGFTGRLIGYQWLFHVSLFSWMLFDLRYSNIRVRFILYANKLSIYLSIISIYPYIDLHIYLSCLHHWLNV